MLKTKRWNDEREADDGFRVLVCRYRPRALPKAQETWDEWWKVLGPSKELHAAFYGKEGEPITWKEYRRKYLQEIRDSAEAQAKLEELAGRLRAGETVTLLCSKACTDAGTCHRTLLKGLIEERL